MRRQLQRVATLGLAFVGLAPTAPALTLQQVRGGLSSYTVAAVDLRRDDLRLHWLNPTTGQPYLTFAQLRERLRKEGSRALFMTNSGIYAPGFKPLGLHVEQGREEVPLNFARTGGNFAWQPNGVFWVDGRRAGVTETDEYVSRRLHPQYAAQSGPLLVRRGQLPPSFDPHSTSFKLRSGVGVCSDGRVRFAVSNAPVNFYAFAIFFRDTLHCPDALYLDGSISAYATPGTDTQLANFAGIWSVAAPVPRN
ncbi:phosphodiester glycosidase family protein [Deinococcus sp. Marseille-Q6407]|uniref:phosphodiester glycosidase family protein n=1 Tax=Deinococcus sp. Marseille-Q6407 TaxID=2969223 RepID=UPI0021BF8CD9|nr:phosphodiester glycosidase family protein [Deinococcus sp. Marseille-Q6407]